MFNKPARWQIAIWGSLLLMALLISVRDYDSFQLGVWVDDARYVTLAHSLVYSDTYGLANAPGEPGDTRYPAGYPLLLAALVRLFPRQIVALKLLSLLATLINATLLFWGWRWLNRRRSYNWALAVTALYLLAPLTIGHTRMVMSEPIFLTWCLITLIAVECAANEQAPGRGAFVLGLGMTLAVFTRTIGVTLVAAVLIYLLLVKKRAAWGHLLLSAGVMVVATGIIVSATAVALADLWPVEYIQQFVAPPESWHTEAPLWPRLTAAIELYFGYHLRQVVLMFSGESIWQIWATRIGFSYLPALFGFAISGMIAGGLIYEQRRVGLSSYVIFIGFYLAAIILWPWQNPRLLYPVQPQLVFGMLLGVEMIIARLGARLSSDGDAAKWPRVTIGGVVAGLLFLAVFQSMTIADTRLHVGDLQAPAEWLKANTHVTDVVMAEIPQIVYLYSGRKTVPYPDRLFSSAGQLENYVLETGTDYILVAPALMWQQQYTPTHSAKSDQALGLLTEVWLQGRANLVYSSETDRVYVYSLQ